MSLQHFVQFKSEGSRFFIRLRVNYERQGNHRFHFFWVQNKNKIENQIVPRKRRFDWASLPWPTNRWWSKQKLSFHFFTQMEFNLNSNLMQYLRNG